MKKIILILCLAGCSSKMDIKRIPISVGETEIIMIWIPGGSFQMGSKDPMARADEQPIHSVKIDGFWMSETPVTNEQFATFINQTN